MKYILTVLFLFIPTMVFCMGLGDGTGASFAGLFGVLQLISVELIIVKLFISRRHLQNKSFVKHKKWISIVLLFTVFCIQYMIATFVTMSMLLQYNSLIYAVILVGVLMIFVRPLSPIRNKRILRNKVLNAGYFLLLTFPTFLVIIHTIGLWHTTGMSYEAFIFSWKQFLSNIFSNLIDSILNYHKTIVSFWILPVTICTVAYLYNLISFILILRKTTKQTSNDSHIC